MRLRHDLERLAETAPSPPDPDAVLRRAQAIRARRLVVVPAVAVVAVLALTITYLSRVDGGGPAASVAFQFEGAGTDPAALDRARGVLEARAKAAGLGHPRATVDGDRILLEYDADGPEVDFKQLAAPGRLEIRKVLDTADGWGTTPPSQAGSGSAAPSTPAASVAPTAGASTLDEVIAKVGREAYEQAKALNKVARDPFPSFASLTPKEVRLLPTRMQFYVPSVSCQQLTADPIPAAEPSAEVTTCMGGQLKLLMDRATLSGADVARAVPEKDPPILQSAAYTVTLKLNRAGQPKWEELTGQASSGTGCVPYDGQGHCKVAFVLDGHVVAAPNLLMRLRGESVTLRHRIPTIGEARMLAAQVGHGELPAGLKVSG